jgi:hypothetical protein
MDLPVIVQQMKLDIAQYKKPIQEAADLAKTFSESAGRFVSKGLKITEDQVKALTKSLDEADKQMQQFGDKAKVRLQKVQDDMSKVRRRARGEGVNNPTEAQLNLVGGMYGSAISSSTGKLLKTKARDILRTKSDTEANAELDKRLEENARKLLAAARQAKKEARAARTLAAERKIAEREVHLATKAKERLDRASDSAVRAERKIAEREVHLAGEGKRRASKAAESATGAERKIAEREVQLAKEARERVERARESATRAERKIAEREVKLAEDARGKTAMLRTTLTSKASAFEKMGMSTQEAKKKAREQMAREGMFGPKFKERQTQADEVTLGRKLVITGGVARNRDNMRRRIRQESTRNLWEQEDTTKARSDANEAKAMVTRGLHQDREKYEAGKLRDDEKNRRWAENNRIKKDQAIENDRRRYEKEQAQQAKDRQKGKEAMDAYREKHRPLTTYENMFGRGKGFLGFGGGMGIGQRRMEQGAVGFYGRGGMAAFGGGTAGGMAGFYSGNRFGGGGIGGRVAGMFGGAAGAGGGALGGGLGMLLGGPAGAVFGSGVGAGFGSLVGGVVGTAISALETILQSVADAALYAGRTLKEFVTHLAEAGMKVERSQAVFGGLLGNRQGGTDLFSSLQTRATQSPYSTEQLSDITKSLLGMGVTAKEITPYLDRLGDVAGGDADRMKRLAITMGETIAEGKLTGQRMRQFATLGIGIKDFADTMGITESEFKQRQHANDVPSTVAIETVNRLTNPGGRFFGQQAAVMDTTSGQYERFNKILDVVAGKMGLALINTRGLKDAMKGINDWLVTMQQPLTALAEKFGTMTTGFLSAFRDMLPGKAEGGGMVEWLNSIMPNEEQAKNFGKSLIDASLEVTSAIGDMVSNTLTYMEEWVQYFRDLKEELSTLFGILGGNRFGAKLGPNAQSKLTNQQQQDTQVADARGGWLRQLYELPDELIRSFSNLGEDLGINIGGHRARETPRMKREREILERFDTGDRGRPSQGWDTKKQWLRDRVKPIAQGDFSEPPIIDPAIELAARDEQLRLRQEFEDNLGAGDLGIHLPSQDEIDPFGNKVRYTNMGFGRVDPQGLLSLDPNLFPEKEMKERINAMAWQQDPTLVGPLGTSIGGVNFTPGAGGREDIPGKAAGPSKLAQTAQDWVREHLGSGGNFGQPGSGITALEKFRAAMKGGAEAFLPAMNAMPIAGEDAEQAKARVEAAQRAREGFKQWQFKSFEELKASTIGQTTPADRLVSESTIGSAEAQDDINKAMAQNVPIQEQILQAIQAGMDLDKQRNEYMQKFNETMEKLPAEIAAKAGIVMMPGEKR